MFDAFIMFLHSVLNFILDVKHTDSVGFYFYWIPVGVCLLGYFLDCSRDYKADIDNHIKDYYSPKLTVGKIVARLIVSFFPVVNIPVAIFSHLFELVHKIFEFCYDTLNIPLIRHRPMVNKIDK